MNVKELPVLLLVGGMGTRLRSVIATKPKPLAPLGDRPFLELLLWQLRAQGLKRLIMCTGHCADQIEKQFGNGTDWGIAIEYSRESQPLGTAGAVKLAERYLEGDSDFVVMNGDSFLEVDFPKLIRFHNEHNGVVTIGISYVSNTARFGTVQIDAESRVLAFKEKQELEEPGFINGGVYVFRHAVLGRLPNGPGSLERDTFPQLLKKGIFAARQNGVFIDIGTPEDYARAQALYHTLQRAAYAEKKEATVCAEGTLPRSRRRH